MTTIAGQSGAPDILDVIADLSNDEVFTPPRLVRTILDELPADLWTDPSLRWLDLGSKTGVFLREITRRLMVGLEAEIPSEQDRLRHILREQVFGVAVTELTAAMSRRTLYCSKDASGASSVVTMPTPDGNVWFERVEHTVVDGKCQECGAVAATLERGEDRENYAYGFIHITGLKSIEEAFGMRFDVIVGNPPYQLDDGGYGTSSAPIYQLFVEQAKTLNPRYMAMIIPSRWFTGGKGLDAFRESMLDDDRTRSIDDFLTASDVFPGVGLKGGVCYFLWDRDHPGLCRVSTHFKGWPDSVDTRPLREPGADVFIRFNQGLSILKKVMAVENGGHDTVVLPPEKRFDSLVSSLRPFGLRTYFKGKAQPEEDDLKVFQNGGIGYIAREEIATGTNLIDCWKVFLGRAAPGTGNKDTYPHRIISTPFIGAPGSISSETYLAIGPLGSEAEAESVLSYLSCRLTRLLILLHKPAQDTTRRVYTFVPKQDWTRNWTDADLYTKYGITEDEQAFIDAIIKDLPA